MSFWQQPKKKPQQGNPTTINEHLIRVQKTLPSSFKLPKIDRALCARAYGEQCAVVTQTPSYIIKNVRSKAKAKALTMALTAAIMREIK